MTQEESMVWTLRDICDKRSTGFLESHPINVYRRLIKNDEMDEGLAGALLLTLLAHIPTLALEERDVHALERAISRACPLTQETCERLARIYHDLFDASNTDRWNELAYRGLEELRGASLVLTWAGESVWRPGSADLVCHFRADITLVGRNPEEDKVDKALEENPLLAAQDIRDMFASSLCSYLDDRFEYFVTADDYYPPLVSEFEAEHYADVWCSRHGFELSAIEGKGWDDGFEFPSRRRR